MSMGPVFIIRREFAPQTIIYAGVSHVTGQISYAAALSKNR